MYIGVGVQIRHECYNANINLYKNDTIVIVKADFDCESSGTDALQLNSS